ncbi:MAG TPA: putative Ig domain-containing protein, partial [Candidatus Acidoferrales bacterium]|nr:putative Ig domain-containing protein [Candidatus Acidoferrales bacterium]
QQSVNGNQTLIIPSNVSTMNVAVACTCYQGGIMKISGMYLRKKLPVQLKIVSSPDTMVANNANYSSQIQTASVYPGDIISYNLSVAPSWLQISNTGVLSGIAPSSVSVFPVTIVASDQHGDKDSISFNLHVVDPIGAIEISSPPDTVVAPNATYYYSVYATGSYLTDTLQYIKLSGPDWLSMSPDGILIGTAPATDSITHMVSILVRDQHADADTQSFSLAVHPLVLDDFSYSDSPLNHGWISTLGNGTTSVGFDSTINARTMNLSTSGGLDFGVDKYGRWLANTITAQVKSSSDFMLKVWVTDSNGTSVYLQYFSSDGETTTGSGNTISFYLGSQIKNGSWQSFARNLSFDLNNAKWGATVRRVLGFSIRGTIQIGDLELGGNPNGLDASLVVQANDFLAKPDFGSVTLSWKTQSEVNNAGFNILRQDPGIASFMPIANYRSNNALKGMGTNSVGRSYAFMDTKVKSGSTYQYKIQSVTTGGITKDLTTLKATVGVPEEYALYQNYPNPFNPSTTIRFDLKQASRVTLEIYNMLGQKVQCWSYGLMDAGRYNETVNMDRLASGAYYYRISAFGNDGKRFVSVRKLLLMK